MAKKKSEGKKGEGKDSNRHILYLLLAAFAITLLFYFLIGQDKRIIEDDIKETVVRVIDGDTFELESGEKVRLICVNAPEENQGGFAESKKFLEDLILNQEVVLKKDVSDADKYQRLLRYVYLETQTKTIFVNQELVNQGYATIYPVEPDTSLCDEIAGTSPSMHPVN